jgi:hypothetical protein
MADDNGIMNKMNNYELRKELKRIPIWRICGKYLKVVENRKLGGVWNRSRTVAILLKSQMTPSTNDS